MRLSLRLVAERSDRPGALGAYLDDPLLLFIPVRLLLGLVTGAATALLARGIGVDGAHTLGLVVLSVAVFVVVCELLLPLAIVGRDPERVLEILLPSFAPIARALGPMTRWFARMVADTKRQTGQPPTPDEAAEEANEAAKAYIESAEQEGLIEGEERRLLQSIVDFGDTLVREVMTPRPDIVAIREDATVGDLRALFRRAGVLAVPGLQGQPRQHRRLRLRQGSRRARHGRRCAADHAAAAAGGRRAGDQARAGAAEAVSAPADAVRDRRRRIRRHGGPRHDRRSARRDRRRDSRRVRRRVRADRRRGRRPLRVQRQGQHRRGGAAAERPDRARRLRDRRRLPAVARRARPGRGRALRRRRLDRRGARRRAPAHQQRCASRRAPRW